MLRPSGERPTSGSVGRHWSALSPLHAVPVLGLAALACACGEREPSVRAIEKTQVVEGEAGGFEHDASTAERFGLRAPGPAAPAPSGESSPEQPHWETPAGWVELESSALRTANFTVGEGAECYLTVLEGDGGGLEANVNRWRKQMSLPEATGAEIDASPRLPFFGGEGLFVDFEGTFTGMGAGASAGKPDYRLVGLLDLADGEARFLKFVGPKDVVARELPAFLELAASFHAGHAGGHGDEPGASAGLAAAPSAAGGEEHGGGFVWEAPGSWRRAPERMMRVVTYHVGSATPGSGEEQAECYVVVLAGDGGGAFANVNRWCSQMGAAELSRAEFEALERVPMLDGEGLVVEVAGHYEGMSGEKVADALLLGAIRELGGSSVFIKLVGPAEVVTPERDAFLAFCRSLRSERSGG